MDRVIYDLESLLTLLRESVEDAFPDSLWVRAEISSVNARSNGHCYIELSQSDGRGLTAKARAVIWKGRYAVLSAYFREATGSPLQAGMSIMALCRVEFSELYGLTLIIEDLDADVTLGEMERRRRETIGKLEKEGLLDLQQGLELTALPYRLAVISAGDAAGYGDFCRHLEDNQYGFRFAPVLFEATMQGATAPESISDALDAVQASADPYDAILIMRGGGSSLDLACFDDYTLCCNIARCPVPVFTAIGHDRDSHVADMVAYASVKTPTALADEFIACYMAEDERIASYSGRLRTALASKLSLMLSRVEALGERIHAADPRNVLGRGYTLAVDASGHVLKSAASLRPGDSVRLMFSDGTVNLKVTDDGR